MTEIWLNYGPTDLVVDISAENLGDLVNRLYMMQE